VLTRLRLRYVPSSSGHSVQRMRKREVKRKSGEGTKEKNGGEKVKWRKKREITDDEKVVQKVKERGKNEKQ
jgi:hypothetical protein